ncbi:MAG: hypothetical protein K2W91_04335 [Novosphingobium sp.]|nr:hypothetical protein [Novosphingobium sp.]
MPERVTKNRVLEFLESLSEEGGACSNGRLRGKLEWDEEFYWRVQGKLVEEGKIVPGRGRGGSVRLTEGDVPENEAAASPLNGSSSERIAERDLYEPMRSTIETTWVKRFGYDDVRVEETHSRGSKKTGGTFTRPDITVIGVRRYVFLQKRIEAITFEIKPADSIGIIGVLEAVAHREASHMAYVIFACPRSSFESSVESERIFELAQKFGVGLVVAESPKQVETWEIIIDAVRHEPDPARLDRFLGDLPNDTLKKQIHKWMT